MSKPTYDELVQAAAEYREGCCAAMRVMAGIDLAAGLLGDDVCARFQAECHSVGLKDGFGKRNDEIIYRAKEAMA